MESNDDNVDDSSTVSTESAQNSLSESESIIASYRRRRLGGYKRRYEDFRKVLLRYRELHGNMHILPSFVVPYKSKDWDKDLWGIRVGYTVSNVRAGRFFTNNREDLLSIGFEYSRKIGGFNLAKAILLHYKEIYGDLLVPLSFVVPKNDESWPDDSWGSKLGSIVNSIRLGRSHTNYYEDLLSIGFDFRLNIVGYQLAKQTLLLYKEIHGDMLVPTDFEVPRDSDIWPEDSWGIKLGNLVIDIRRGVEFSYKYDELLDIGFTF